MNEEKNNNEIKLLVEPVDKKDEVKEARPAFAEASAGDKSLADKSTGKRDFYVELFLFLVLGILVGIAVKTEANKRITIGYNDYRMKIGTQQYSINNLQADLAKKQSAAADNAGSPGANHNSADGASCTSNQ